MDEPRSESESDSHAIASDRPTVRALAGLLAVLASCQAYEPRPLDAAAHRESWHARTLEQGALEPFLGRLRLDVPEQAVGLDPADGLSLREGRLVALVFHPELRLARLRAGRAAASAEHARRWDDPELALDALWITESVRDRWVVTPGLAFSIPLSGRVSAEGDLADAEVRAAELAVLEAEWAVWHAVDRAWVEWSALQLRVGETAGLLEALDALVPATSALAERGELARTEASLFAVEQARRRNHLGRLRGEVEAAEQRLRATLGLAPEAPVSFLPSLDTGTERPPQDTGAGAGHPTLARLRAEYAVAEETLRTEIARQLPDLTLGPLYESDQGQSRAGLLGALPLPFLNANRRAIAEARVAREVARAAFETEYESLVGRRAAAGARIAALAEQRADMEAVLVPLVDQQLADAVELLRLGEGSSLVLLESLGRAHQTKLELIETRSSEALAAAELEHLTGPPVQVPPNEAKGKEDAR